MRWKSVFEKCGFELGAKITTEDWSMPMPIWQRIPFVCKNRHQALVVLRKRPGDLPGNLVPGIS
jgi:hypothetical protein